MPQLLVSSAAPMYVQLKEALRHDITTSLKPGDLVPSEVALIAEYGVSRTTVRLALTALTNEGVIVRKQGRGSFVSERKQTVSIGQALLDSGADVTVAMHLISVDEAVPDSDVCHALGVSEDEVVARVRWTEHDNDPGASRCYRVSYLLVGSIRPESLLQSHSIDELRKELQLLLVGCSAKPTVVSRYVSVMLADPFRAKMIEVPEGTPLVRVESVLRSASGQTLEVARAYYGGHSTRVQLD